MIKIAFCNDCDGLEWNDFIFLHDLLDDLGLPAGDSFWLFDPTDSSDMALFRNNVSEKAKNHDHLLEQIKNGRVDVLHSLGDFHSVSDINGYIYPSREHVKEALSFLSHNDCHIKIHTVHGNTLNIHNTAYGIRRRYQHGDLPYSDFFLEDLLKQYGIEFFWSSELMENLDRPRRIVRPVRSLAGNTLLSFIRFGQWGESAHTLPSLLRDEHLNQAIKLEQNLVIFTHWGVKGRKSPNPDLPLWHEGNLEVFDRLSKMQREGALKVVRLEDLLREESEKTLESEIDRIADSLVNSTPLKNTNRYYVDMYTGQYGAQVYREVVDSIGVFGKKALDIGGGGGNLSLQLSLSFDRVDCVDTCEDALALGAAMTGALGIDNVVFSKTDAEGGHFGNDYDLICCRGILYLVDGRQLLKSVRCSLKENGIVYISANADGFYHHYIDNVETKKSYLELLWNTAFKRLGGVSGVLQIIKNKNIQQLIKRTKSGDRLFSMLLDNNYFEHGDIISKYSGRVKLYVADKLTKYFSKLNYSLHAMNRLPWANAQRQSPNTSRWICYHPDEMKQLLEKSGFILIEHKLISQMGASNAEAFTCGDFYNEMPTCINYYAVLK